MPGKRLRDLVILLPGITGSVLQKDGRDVWAPSGGAVWEALTSRGGSLRDLVLEADDPDRDDLGDGVRAVRVVPDVHLIPGFWKIDGYSETVRLITQNFSVVKGAVDDGRPANFIEFPYDWRRDNRVAARRLQRLIAERLPLWRDYSGAADAKAILLAHSMGGLVARHYLEVLEGWRDCRALITFGTPYRGAPQALGFLANGYKQLFLDLSEVMRSFTSAYQLLPIYQAVRVGGEYRRAAETDGIPGLVRARAEQALAFHREIERAVAEHRRSVAYRDGFVTLPIVGTRQPTEQSAELTGGRLSLSRALPAGADELLDQGDGTVPRLSAIPIELSTEYRDSFFAERHGSLQRNPAVLNDLLGRLEQMQVTGLGTLRGPAPSPQAAERPAISLDLDDLYLAGEAVELRARLFNADPAVGAPLARVTPAGRTPGAAAEREFRQEGSEWVLRLEELPPALYRVTVRTASANRRAPEPVQDLFEVAGTAG